MMVKLSSDKIRVGIVLVLLLIGFLTVSLGSYLALTYTQGNEVILLPHPPYCAERTVTGTLTPENPNFTLNITYFAFGFEGNPMSGITPTLIGWFEANDTVDFYINDSNKPHENPIFRVNGTKNSNFTATFSTWAGVYSGVWSLNLQNNSTTPLNFTLRYYKKIVGDINLISSQERITSAIYLRMFKDSFSVHAFYESSWLYVGVGGGFLLVSSSRGGLWNHQILRNAYVLTILGGVIIAIGVGIEVLRRREG
ncbi:MAG: hypothetical protein ACTSV0_09125 [Candidatus Freyarchaeota archaeon]